MDKLHLQRFAKAHKVDIIAGTLVTKDRRYKAGNQTVISEEVKHVSLGVPDNKADQIEALLEEKGYNTTQEATYGGRTIISVKR